MIARPSTLSSTVLAAPLSLSRIGTAVRNHWGVIALVLATIPLALLYFRWLGYDLGAFSFNPLGDRADTIFNSWTISQAIDNLLHRPLQLGYAPILAGDANAFNYTIAPYGIAIVTLPIYLLTGQNLALTYNIYLIGTYTLTALSVYWLVRYLVGAPAAVGVLIGLQIAFLPYRDLQLHHIETLSMQFFFWTLIAFHKLIDRPGWRWSIALALLFSLTILTSGYLGLTLVVGFVILAIYLIFRRPKVISRRLIVAAVGAAALSVILIAPFLASRLGNPTFSRGYQLLEIEWYSGTLIGWFSSLALIYHDIVPFQAEATLFMGFVPLTLSAIAYLFRHRLTTRRSSAVAINADEPTAITIAGGSKWFPLHSLIVAYAILIVSGYIISLGPAASLGKLGGIPLPYAFLMQIPGFAYLRVPARFIMLAIAGLAVLSAYTLTLLVRTQRRWLGIAALCVIAAAIAVECVPTPLAGSGNLLSVAFQKFNSLPIINSEVEFTNGDAYQWLATQPPGSVVLHYPLGDGAIQAQVTEQYIYDQVQYKQPIINGWGSTLPDWYKDADWGNFPNAPTLAIIQGRQTRFVLVHPDNFVGDEQAAFKTRLAPYVADGTLTLIKQFKTVDVYAVK